MKSILQAGRKSFAKPKILAIWLIFAVLMALPVSLLPRSASAAVGVNQQINFQARLLNAQGATVPDGNYNIEFKIYQDGDGLSAGNSTGTPAGSLKWTEDWLNNNTQGVTVKNGYFSVYLGKITSLAAIDFNQDTLWLSLNVGNTNTTCTPFSSCVGDGEMLPMKRLASSPYALNSSKLGGLSSTQYVQLAQGVQSDASTTQPSIFINKTGATANVIQLQRASADVLAIDTNGVTTLQGATGNNATLVVKQASTAASGDIFGVLGANGTTKFISVTSTAANAGTVTIQSVGVSNALTLDSGSGAVILGSNTVKLQKAGTAFAFELNNVGASTLTVTNTGGGTASLSVQGTIAAATTNTINSVSINAGAISTARNGAGTGDSTLAVTGTTVADATSSQVRIGGAIAGGSASGTYLGVNAASGFAGNLADLQTNGTAVLRVNSLGDVTSGFTVLNGSSATSAAAIVASATMALNSSSAAFDVGNYIKVVSGSACSAAVTTCYAKITANNTGTNTLTISPSLTWTITSAVTEWHVPEVGGIDLSQTLTNRFGQGYFVNGVTTGNGSTDYTDGSISSSVATFNLLSSNVTTLNIGAAATSVNIGVAGGTTTIQGNLTVGSNTLTGNGSGLTNLNPTNIVQGSGAVTLQSAAAAALTITGNAASTFSTSTGALTVQSGSGTLSLGTSTILAANGALTVQSNAAADLTLSSSSGTIQAGSNALTTTGTVTVGTLNAQGGTIKTNTTDRITNAGGLTNITNFTQSSGTHAISSVTTSGDIFSIANSSLNTSGANLANLTVKNNNTAAAGLTVNGLTLTPTSATPASGSNTLNALNLVGVTPAASQIFNGLNIGANYSSALLVGGTSIINGTGVVQTAGISGSYTGITGTGALTAGSLTTGFTAVNVAQGGTGAATLTANAILQGNGTGAVSGISPGLAGTVLLSNGTTSSFTTITNTSLTAGTFSNITGVGTLGSLTLTGAISGGTTYSGSGNITSTGGSVVAAAYTGPGAVSLTSGGANALTLDTGGAAAINIGTTNTNAINLQQATTLSANKNLSLASGTGTFSQTYTGTTADARTLVANSLTTAAALRVTSSNNSAANTAWSAISLNTTNAQGTTAVSTGTISGFDLQFTQNASIAGNTETVANFAVSQIDTSVTDNAVSSILNLANNDTATGNQITVTDGLRINGANLTNGINLSGTFGANLITSTNFVVAQGGTITVAGSAGVTRSCGGAQTLNGLTTVGGIVTAGTCANNLTDIAEQYDSTQTLEPGDVVATDHTKYPNVLRTTAENQPDLLGIVSTAPYRVLGDANPGYPIALIGRVPTKVSTENGPIVVGDHLTSSSTRPGFAVKSTKPGMSIGVALQDYSGPTASNKIEVFVHPAWWAPAFGDSLQGTQFADINVGGKAVIADLVVLGSAVFEGDITVKGHIVGNADTRGEVMVAPGQTSLRQDFSKAYTSRPVVVASPSGQNNFVEYSVESDTTGFTIYLKYPAITSVKFNYLVQQ